MEPRQSSQIILLTGVRLYRTINTVKFGKFRHKGLKWLYEDSDASGLPPATVKRIRNILAALEFAADLSQVETLPGWRLHPLKGLRRGDYAISVTGN